jgi:hypothetical protein
MTISIERTDQNIKIILPVDTDPIDLQNALSYLKYTDIVQRSKATEQDVQDLAKSVKSAMSKDIIQELRKLDEFKDL